MKKTLKYITKFGGIYIEKDVFREKLKAALKRKGYVTVNNFQKSEYYLFINFSNRLQENLNQKRNPDSFSLELFLIESKNISDSSGMPFERDDAVWVCKIELTRLDFLKHQDDLMENISKYFCNTHYGRRILF